jgi:hypothetical protein
MSEQIERLKVDLTDVKRNRDFFVRYVSELERNRLKEDVFIRMAFQDVMGGGAGTGPYVSPASTRSFMSRSPLSSARA